MLVLAASDGLRTPRLSDPRRSANDFTPSVIIAVDRPRAVLCSGCGKRGHAVHENNTTSKAGTIEKSGDVCQHKQAVS